MDTYDWDKINDKDIKRNILPGDDIVEDAISWQKIMKFMLVGITLSTITFNY